MKTYRWLWVSVLVFGSVMALLWMVAVQPRSVRAAVLCVNPTGTGGCYTSIQDAVIAAGDGDTIRVAYEVYFENVEITKSLILEGGWNADFTARDWDTYVTTIDAGGNGPAVRTETPWGAAITVTIEGFTLVHGDDSASLGWGGGLQLRDLFNGDSQFYVRHNVISNNIACQTSSCQGQGGGIYLYGGAAVIEDNFIGNNIARMDSNGRGGGISVGGYGEVTIKRNTIIANTAVITAIGSGEGKGGGVDLEYAGDATLRDNEISKNFAAVNGTGCGGGIYAKGDIYDNVIDGNFASVNGTGYGGGVYAYHVSTVAHNTVKGNFASQHGDGTGGGIYVVYQQNAHHNHIIDNEAQRGGGVYFNTYSGEENFTYNYVARNRASGTNDATSDGGGGIASAANWVDIIDNTIISNTAYYGGGVQILSGDLYRVHNNQIELNVSTLGGGIYVENATGSMIANTIFDNDSVWGGGIAVWEAANPVIERNVILSNTATGFWGAAGGGILVYVNDGTNVNLTNNLIAQNAAGGGGRGGGVLFFRGNCSLTHNTIVDNDRGTYQEGVILGSSYGGSFTLRNNIIAGHNTGVELLSGSATSNYNDFYDNTTNLVGIAMGAQDHDWHPQFVDRSGGDYHLAMTSPLIDQGLGGLGITHDFEGDPRPHGAGVDIGADEAYRSETYVSEHTGSDSTGDGSSDYPYATVTRGIYETSANGTVYVGRGHYLETVGIHRSLNLLGGYNEEDWGRDIVLNETILDAQNLATVVVIYGEGVQGLIEGFTITNGDGSFYGNGGGIMVSDHAVAIIRHNVITGNHASNGGGGIALWGNEDFESVIDSNTICGNVSDGVFTPLETSDPLAPEQGPEPGGGLWIVSPARVVNNFIYGNTAAAGGDGLALSGWRNMQVFHNTIVDNGGSGGAGLEIFGFGSEPAFGIYNNLIVGHGVGIRTPIPAQALWDYNGFYNNGMNYAAGLEVGPNDVHGNPFFVDSAAGNYHITVASVAAGTGSDVDVVVDFDGDPRPAPPDSPPDIGADEITQRRLFLPLVRK